MEEEPIRFIDAEQEYSPDKKFTFKEIVMNTIRKIRQLSSKELRGGFTIQQTKIMGNAVLNSEVYVEDSREALSNCIEYLSNILAPHYNDEMKGNEEDIIKQINELSKEDGQKYRTEKVKLRIQLFRYINFFLKEIDYLRIGDLEE